MADPYVTIDLDKIEHNARTIVELCRAHGIEVTGVTKGTCGHPEVAKSMLRGGVSSIGESRMENVRRLKGAGVDASYMLLRIPSLSAVDEVVESVDLSLNSELSVLAGLSQAACRRGRVHQVIVMVDLGDLREGVWPDDLVAFVRQALRLPGIRLVGLGANLTCFGGVVPSEDNMNRLVDCARDIEHTFGLALDRISGSNSSALELIAAGAMPERINHARIGEAILLGRETVHRRPWPGTFQDAFSLHAEVLELKRKPSLPIGERGEDAFGRVPAFVDRGELHRAILNVGRQDVDIEGLAPVDPAFTILGASSGYVIVDVTAAQDRLGVGDELTFSLNYGALVAAMTSHYVDKRLVRGEVPVRATPQTV
jgi:predicted amino acid racemase